MSSRKPTIRVYYSSSCDDFYAACPVCPSFVIYRKSVTAVRHNMVQHGRTFQHGWDKIEWRMFT